MTSVALARAIAAGDISAREATQACMDRIDATDGAINAFTSKSYPRALLEADAVDAKRARGEVLPPLVGTETTTQRISASPNSSTAV